VLIFYNNNNNNNNNNNQLQKMEIHVTSTTLSPAPTSHGFFGRPRNARTLTIEEKNKRQTTMTGQYAYIYKQYIKCYYYYYYCKNVNERFFASILVFIYTHLYIDTLYNDRLREVISYLTISAHRKTIL